MPTRLWLRAAELLITATLAIAILSAWRADRRDRPQLPPALPPPNQDLAQPDPGAAEPLIPESLAAAILSACPAARRDRAQLAADLAAAKQELAQADARQHERDAQLVQTLATLAAEKRTITTPAQIVRDLPQQISLPSPIVLQPAPSPNPGADPTRPANAADPARDSNQSQAAIPAEDLKPLYDFTLDCKACQSKLTATQGDLADERSKTAILTPERHAAVRPAQGGSDFR